MNPHEQKGPFLLRQEVVKRSVRVAAHRTSVSLEPAFWEELKGIARERNCSLNKLVAEIDVSRAGNLSSALRLFVLRDLKERLKMR